VKRAPLTLRGAERLRAELKKLKAEDRPRVIKAIAEARSHGDLSENAEYHAAREQQGFIEGRISEIESQLATAEIIDVSRLSAGGRVVFGSTVDLEDQDDGSKVVYELVGDAEADIRHSRIAVSSPIARALIGKSVGDVVDVVAPAGTRSYEIIAVRAPAVMAKKKATRRSSSSRRWLQEHVSDEYVQRARREGWRSRAVYKLEQIHRSDRILKAGALVIDLGAAPGAWSQYAVRQLGAKGELIAVDLVPMDPIGGVHFIQGDFREQPVLDEVLARIAGRPVDLVMSDMAPSLSGLDVVDQPRAMYLTELALEFSRQVLKPGGTLLAKVFQGSGFQELVAATRTSFNEVRLRKPVASRARSAEMYLLAKGFRL
jgi:23S rRNA (uridine2552-2'-O)-methyltransferase